MVCIGVCVCHLHTPTFMGAADREISNSPLLADKLSKRL